MKRNILALILAPVLAIHLSPKISESYALDVAGMNCVRSVCFPKEVQIGPGTVPLLGMSLFRYWMFDVYTAALYGPDAWRTTREFKTGVPSKLVIEYHRDLSAVDIAKSADQMLQSQNNGIPEEVAAGVKSIHSIYKDVTKGDRYELRYEPGRGTSLWFNNELAGSVPGELFADYYFRIWLDSRNPIDGALRDALFGKDES